MVVVAGDFPSASSAPILCRFGAAAAVQGAYLSPTAVHCVAPAQAAGAVALEVGSNGQLWTSDGVQFTYYPPYTLSSVAPALGPADGGTAVAFTGGPFPLLSIAVCRVGPTLIPAVVASTTAVTCTAPALLPGNHSLAVAVNGAEFVALAGGVWQAYAAPVFAAVAPVLVPVATTTSLTLTAASALLAQATPLCRFTTEAGLVVTQTTAAALPDPLTLQCDGPSAASPGWWALAVALNGVDWQETGLRLQAAAVASLASVQPATVSVTGGAVVTVAGAGFTSSALLSCDIAGVLTPLTYLAATSVLCLVPAAASTGSVSLSIVSKADGVAFSSVLTLVYHPAVLVSAPTPTAVLSLGGGVLTFAASWVGPELRLQCLFPGVGGVDAAVVSTTAFTCVAPPLAPNAAAMVRVVSQVDPTVEFDFAVSVLPPPTVLGVEPAVGRVTGGTVVTVTGAAFLPSPSCQFSMGASAVVVAASTATATAIICDSPAFGVAGTANVSVSSLPAGSYSASAGAFYYAAGPTIASVSPSAVPLTGDVVVTLVGTGFLALPSLQCGFNVTAADGGLWPVLALATSATTVECVAPVVSGAFTSAAFNATVALSLNGVEWYPSSVLLSFLPPIALLDAAYTYLAGDEGLVAVWGQGLAALPSSAELLLRCVWEFAGGSVSTLATPLNGTLLVCARPLPPAVSGTAVSASLMVTDGVLSSTAAISVTLIPPPVVQLLSSMMPMPGSVLTITGKAFPPAALCLFSSSSLPSFTPMAVSAAVLSPTQVTCVVPALAYSASSAYYVAVLPVGLTSLPSFIPYLPLFSTPQATVSSTSPLTSLYPSTVRVLVSNADASFVNSPWLSCTSDAGTYPALFLNSSAVVCWLPSAAYLTRPSFAVFVSNTPGALSTTVTGYPPLLPQAGAVSPQSLSTSPLLLAPSTAVVLVTGSFFLQSTALSCVVAGVVLPAVFVNASAVTCGLPAEVLSLVAQASALTSATAVSLPLSLTNDGVDLSQVSIALSAAPSPVVTAVQPTHADPTLSILFTVVGSAFTAGGLVRVRTIRLVDVAGGRYLGRRRAPAVPSSRGCTERGAGGGFGHLGC